MGLNRRHLLQAGLALASLRALPAGASSKRIIPWRNWSGAQSCIPAARVAPADEAAIADLIRQSHGTIRPVGSAHSFSGLVPTTGTILSASRLSGLIDIDAENGEARFHGGTPMSLMGEPLRAAGRALSNMADVDYQTLAGALATSTHGTGTGYGSYSTLVRGLRLIDGRGNIIDCDPQTHPALFSAARVSLGALGIVSQVRMDTVPAFNLHEILELRKTEELLQDLPRLLAENQRWEMQVITHSDYALSICLNDTQEPPTYTGPEEDDGSAAYVHAMDKVDQYLGDFRGFQRMVLNLVARTADFEPRIGPSHEIFANVRNVRFNEMEYSVPAEAGPACLREILHRIRERDLPTWFPIEYRYVAADDIPLSMFQGRASCAISIHQHYRLDHHNFFAAVEPIFWKYGGRPHWGKLHSLGAAQLRPLYPQFDDFMAAREALDPDGRFLNAHLRRVLGTD